MKASEIVTKIKDVLLSTSEKEEENFDDVELKEEAPKAKKEAKEENKEQAPAAQGDGRIEYSAEKGAEELQEESEMKHTPDHKEYEENPAVEYATKDEVSELKSMVEKLKGMIEAKEDVKEEVPQELSSEEPAEAINHSPENEVSENNGVRFAPNSNRNTTYNRVLNAISK
jgi:hypothetical protein